MMKKIILTISIILTLGFYASAQSDGFFSNWSDGYSDRASSDFFIPNIGMPDTNIGVTDNSNAPLGNGLIIFSILGAGYFILKNKKN
ncbi:MAG: hypothetical protein IJK92_00920 [Bacteroidales bacterium]|nr:hypothetical protein [Bacteroidales bacterium]